MYSLESRPQSSSAVRSGAAEPTMTSPQAVSEDIRACPDVSCLSFTAAIHTAQPIGHLVTIHHVPTYVSRGNATSNSTIVFLTGGFGFNLVNNKLLADQYASRTGLRVLVPNLLPGGGVPLSLTRLAETLTTPPAWYDLLGHARRALAGLQIVAVLLPFAFRVRHIYPVVLGYVRAVRASLPLGAKLGLAGFCLGARWSSCVCAELATADDGRRDGQRLVDAHFAAHPPSLAADELTALAARYRVPFSLALGDEDPVMSVEQVRRVEAGLDEVFRDDPDRWQVVVYEKCSHGFALRADPKQTDEDEGAERALDQAVAWFRRFLV